MAGVDCAPVPTAVRAFEYAAAICPRIVCPRIKGGRRRRVNCQGANNEISQAGVDRAPVPAAVRAFEYAAALCLRIEGGRRRRVNR